MKELDQTNRKILTLLQDNGRMTNAELAERTGLSPAGTLERVKKLERRGVILKYVALVDPVQLGKNLVAFVTLSLVSHRAEVVENFRRQVCRLDQVLECYHISGDSDYILKVLTHDMADYEHFLIHTLAALDGVGQVRTQFVMANVKQGTSIPID